VKKETTGLFHLKGGLPSWHTPLSFQDHDEGKMKIPGTQGSPVFLGGSMKIENLVRCQPPHCQTT